MSSAKRLMVAGLLAVAVMVPFILQRGTLNQLRAENQRLQMRNDELAAELQRASTNLVRTNATGPGSLSRDQLHELMRLRAEVTALRRLTNAAPVMTEIRVPPRPNPDLTDPDVAGAPPEGMLTTNTPPWNNSGFARPADTLSTLLWGMQQGRIDLVLNTATPEGQIQLQQEYGTVPQPAEKLQSEAGKVLEVRPSAAHTPTENEVYMTMVVEEPPRQILAGEAESGGVPAGTPITIGAQRREVVVRLQKIGNDWRYAGRTGF